MVLKEEQNGMSKMWRCAFSRHSDISLAAAINASTTLSDTCRRSRRDASQINTKLLAAHLDRTREVNKAILTN
jgi:hypothetical protein